MKRYKEHLEDGCVVCGSEATYETTVNVVTYGSYATDGNGEDVTGCICDSCGHTEIKPSKKEDK